LGAGQPGMGLIDADLRRCALYLIGLHGPKPAATRALLRASTLYERGERDAADIWFQIGALIRRIEAEKPAPGETVQ
jgi:hypothetical protein